MSDKPMIVKSASGAMVSTTVQITRPPLPRTGSLGLIQYAGVDMHAYADTVLAAARDCRTCGYFAPARLECRVADKPCINADRYEPLPPVRFWRKSE